MNKKDEDYNLRSLLEWVKEYGDNGDLPNQDGSGEDAYNFAKTLLAHMDGSHYYDLRKTIPI